MLCKTPVYSFKDTVPLLLNWIYESLLVCMTLSIVVYEIQSGLQMTDICQRFHFYIPVSHAADKGAASLVLSVTVVKKVKGELCLNPVVLPLPVSLGRCQLSPVPLLK